MTVVLRDTTASEIAARILKERRNLGTASGLVLTLVVITDARRFRKALDAAMEAGREHPSRVLVVVAGRSPATRLDAEIFMGEGVPGDVVTLRLGGELADHADSVVLPLLLPDSPVVAWWPDESPTDPGRDQVGVLATRRITDAAGSSDPLEALRLRALHHSPGDTDLTWTRLTPWRALLAAALDQYHGRITGAEVAAAADNAPAELMAAWLEEALDVPVERRATRGPGITSVQLHSLAGDVTISREPEAVTASFKIPGQPAREVALRRRDSNQLITEELRRMQPDEVFEMAAAKMLDRLERGLVHTRRHNGASRRIKTSSSSKTSGTVSRAATSKAAHETPTKDGSPKDGSGKDGSGKDPSTNDTATKETSQ